ncbi:MAG: hypothetical protein V8R75_03125 [Oscillospiraceae bacterium]
MEHPKVHSRDFVACLLQKQSGHGAVHTAAHRDKHMRQDIASLKSIYAFILPDFAKKGKQNFGREHSHGQI